MWRPPTTATGEDVTTAVLGPAAWRAAADRRLRDSPGPRALLIVDVDRLRLVNRTVGRPSGDHVLRSVASVLRTVSAPNGVVGRVGDDEFVLLLAGVDRSTAEGLADRIHHHMTRIVAEDAPPGAHHLAPPGAGEVQVTIGVAATSGSDRPPGSVLPDLFWAADAALYTAKSVNR